MSIDNVINNNRWDFNLDLRLAANPLPDPIGFGMITDFKKSICPPASGDRDSPNASTTVTIDPAMRALLQQKAWTVTTSQAKNIGMSLFMLYMGGSSPGVFNLLILLYSIANTIKSLLDVQNVYRRFEDDPQAGSVFMQKCGYMLLWLLSLAYMLYRSAAIGILPIRTADYVGAIRETKFAQAAIGVYV